MTDSERKDKKNAKVKEQPQGYSEPVRYEIIGGIRYDFLSSPTIAHQYLSARIEQMLHAGCQPDGVILIAPMDVHLDKENVIQPDIIYIQNSNLHIIVDQKIMGTPDLLVEILSPSTSSRDKLMKKQLYEQFGVLEYWIVDPIHFTIDQFVLRDGHFMLHDMYSHGSQVTSPNFPCISINMDDLYKQVERFMPEMD